MSALQNRLDNWSGMSSQPKLTDQQWNTAMVLGVVLLVMAVLQVVSFSQFKNTLDSIGLTSSPALWAVLILVAEVWGSLGFFKIRLNILGRSLSTFFALAAASFWFYENLKLVSQGMTNQLTNSGFFGRYLHQAPGWWTVIEVTVFLFWVLYCLKLVNKAK